MCAQNPTMGTIREDALQVCVSLCMCVCVYVCAQWPQTCAGL